MPLLVLNQSSVFSDDDCKLAIAAINAKLPEFCKERGLGLQAVEFCSDAKAEGPKFLILDGPESKSDSANGYVFAKTILDCRGAKFWKDEYTVTISSDLSHEIMVYLCDPHRNIWVQTGTGTLIPYDVCDPVQGHVVKVEIDGQPVAFANYLLPAWADPHAPEDAKFDHMGILTTPFIHGQCGYLVAVGSDGVQAQMFGKKTNLLLLHHKLESTKTRIHHHVHKRNISSLVKPRSRAS